jgi:uncharacterized delta-60 repeat protein
MPRRPIANLIRVVSESFGDAPPPGRTTLRPDRRIARAAAAVGMPEARTHLPEAMEPRQLMSTAPTPDTTFNGNGQVLADWAGGVYAAVTDAKTLPNGQIIAVGQGTPAGGSTQELFLARFNANGSADDTFGSGGVNYRFYQPFTDGSDVSANNITLLANGEFIVSGSSINASTNVDKGYLFEFKANGTLDTSFGTNGSYTDPVQSIYRVAVQGSDLLIGGLDGTTDFAVSRLTAAGKLDPTFGTAGRVLFTASAVTSLSPSTYSPSGLLSVRADGSFVYSGVVGQNGGRSGLVANFSAKGTLTAGLGSTSGEFLINYGGDDSAFATLTPNGGLLVDDTQFSGEEVNYEIGTVSTTGAKSTPFTIGTEELVFASLGYAGDHYVLQQNGQLVDVAHTAAGDSTGEYNDDVGDADVYRSNTTVTGLDAAFGTGGDYSLADGADASLFPNSASLNASGQLLVAGFAEDANDETDSIMLARFDLSTGTGAITGTVYDDKNLNGTVDAGEALANVPVYADLTHVGHYVSGDPIASTDVFGNYSLAGLTPGTYTVRVDTSLLTGVGVLTPAGGSFTTSVTANGTVAGRNFALAGAGAGVYHGATPIATGESTPTTAAGTDFGAAAVGATGPTETFTIRDVGAEPLTVSNLTVPAGYTLVTAPAGTVQPGATTSFVVQLATAKAGAYAGNVSFTDNATNGTTYAFGITGTVTASTTPTPTTTITTTPAPAQTATAGVAKSFTLGTFAAANATGPYTVTVNWGDGTAATTFTAAAPGAIAAQSHTFAKAGGDTVSVTVKDSAGHSSTAATFAVTVANSVTTLVVTPPVAQATTAGVISTIALGSFTATNPTNTYTGPFTVTVNWGDGTAATSFTTTAAGQIPVLSRAYAKAGAYTASITVKDSAGSTSTPATFAVTVTNQVATSIVVTPPPNTVAVTGQSRAFTLGDFIVSNAAAPYKVTVNWGDGTAATTFTTAAAGSLGFQSHAYAKPGNDKVTITVADSAGHTSTPVTFVVAVSNPTVPNIIYYPPANQTATAGTAKPFTLGTFVANNPTVPYTITINWGDGTPATTVTTSTAGTVTAQPHTYAKAGSDAVTVTVKDAAGVTSNAGTFNVIVTAPTTPTPTPTATLAGAVDKDLTGNGTSADDTGLAGVTVALYRDVDANGVLTGVDARLATTVTGATGTYAFTSLPAGRYLVVETTPAGYLVTAPASGASYAAVTVAAAQQATGPTFDDFLKVTNTGVSGIIYHVNGVAYTTLRGHTFNGATVTATFTVTNPAGEALSLLSYTAASSTFSEATAGQQKVAQQDAGFFKPGTYTLAINLPTTGHYQVDFVEGYALTQLGPIGSNLFYTLEGRLLSADNE